MIEIEGMKEFVLNETVKAHNEENPDIRLGKLLSLATMQGYLEHREWFIKTISMEGSCQD